MLYLNIQFYNLIMYRDSIKTCRKPQNSGINALKLFFLQTSHLILIAFYLIFVPVIKYFCRKYQNCLKLIKNNFFLLWVIPYKTDTLLNFEDLKSIQRLQFFKLVMHLNIFLPPFCKKPLFRVGHKNQE